MREVSCLCTFSGAGPTELGFLQGLGADPEPLQVGLWKPVPPPLPAQLAPLEHSTRFTRLLKGLGWLRSH